MLTITEYYRRLVMLVDCIHRIACENPNEKMWSMFVYFESEPHVKRFLEKTYQANQGQDASRFAFQNTHKFIYYIKQGKEYYNAASTSNILVKPLLIYYGMVSLLKAVIISSDPGYPAHTRVLQHGITSRKLKKLDYSFSEDEVKVQKEGLFPMVASYLNSDHIVGQKFKIKDLLSLIPELRESYEKSYEETTLIPLHISRHIDFSSPVTTFYLPEHILDKYHLTYESFIHFLNRHNQGQARFVPHSLEAPKGIIRISWEHPQDIHVSESPSGFENHLFIQDYKGNHHFLLSDKPELFIPEMLSHYMLMYILGMLCRYETELWGEIIFSFTSGEMFIINEFLNISQRKFPNMILNLLFNERFIFETM
ncbi:YaaC family protein [Ammoniphilus sp. 3BR4]|uniref:YaaC family protein n=1 Tax=Ammoniphilus sp. 3BR4 TaxID=3158265 RepID=UPI0034676060